MKPTWPPPSGNRMVSSNWTLKPFRVSFFPSISCLSSAGQQETTVVTNCKTNIEWKVTRAKKVKLACSCWRVLGISVLSTSLLWFAFAQKNVWQKQTRNINCMTRGMLVLAIDIWRCFAIHARGFQYIGGFRRSGQEKYVGWKVNCSIQCITITWKIYDLYRHKLCAF